MKKPWVIGVLSLSVIALSVIATAVTFPAFFFYHYDRGEFTEVQRVVSPNHLRTAILARRADRQALSSDNWFLLVGEKRSYNQDELSRAFHYRTYSFEDTHESPGNLHLDWGSDANLVVTCSPCEAVPLGVERKRATAGPVHITYVGLPESPFNDPGN
jgi:hypothetical protein